MLTSEQKNKINEIVQEFKESYGVFRRSYGDVPGFWVYAA